MTNLTDGFLGYGKAVTKHMCQIKQQTPKRKFQMKQDIFPVF